MAFLDFFRRRRKRERVAITKETCAARRQGRERVIVSEEAITVVQRDGVEKTVRWDDLREVSIATTDEGPFREDVFDVFLSVDGQSRCVVPQGADGVEKFQDWFGRKLPGFDYEEAIKAMTSAANAKFTCWRHQNT